MSEVRVRFAPSPTGHLHVGGLRTALFNFLFAKSQNGKLILRIEDTDQARKVEGAVENLLESLKWAGLTFDEGQHIGGDCGPYVQSERTQIYRQHVDQLVKQGNAYHCFCTEEDLTKMRALQIEKKQPTRYDGRCRRLKEDEIAKKMEDNTPSVIRMKIIHSKGEYVVDDLIRGRVRFHPSQIDDQILLKSDGFPTYHLANVVDDHLMKVSHVIRGEEWLPSTPKHIQLYEYFGWELPKFAHLPLLLNTDRSKLSKRQGDVATEDYRNKGFLPEALINFVALLGWNTQDTQEIFSLSQLMELFSLERVGKAGAVFDLSKLRWMNQNYIKQQTIEDLLFLLRPFLPASAKSSSDEELLELLAIVRDSLVTLQDIGEKLELFFQDEPVIQDSDLITEVTTDDAKKVFENFIEYAELEESISPDTLGIIMKKVQKATGIKGKNLWMPVRIAITLTKSGPELPLVASVLGKEKCLNMIRNTLKL